MATDSKFLDLPEFHQDLYAYGGGFGMILREINKENPVVEGQIRRFLERAMTSSPGTAKEPGAYAFLIALNFDRIEKMKAEIDAAERSPQ